MAIYQSLGHFQSYTAKEVTIMLNHQKLIITLALVLGASNVSANVVSVTPSSQTVNIGDIFSIAVVGTDFTTALDAGGLDLFFDQNIIAPASLAELPVPASQIAEYGSAWDTNFQPVESANSLTDAFFFSSGVSPSGDFDIVTFWLKAIGVGSSALDLEESALNPFAGGGGALSAEVIDGNVNVVPIPAAVWMFISGLIGLGAVSRRKS